MPSNKKQKQKQDLSDSDEEIKNSHAGMSHVSELKSNASIKNDSLGTSSARKKSHGSRKSTQVQPSDHTKQDVDEDKNKFTPKDQKAQNTKAAIDSDDTDDNEDKNFEIDRTLKKRIT